MSMVSGPMRSITRARRALRSSLRSLAAPARAPSRTAIVKATHSRRARPGDERASNLNQFARIHTIVGIEGALDGAHQLERATVLGVHVFELADADAMLAGAGAAQAQRPRHQP